MISRRGVNAGLASLALAPVIPRPAGAAPPVEIAFMAFRGVSDQGVYFQHSTFETAEGHIERDQQFRYARIGVDTFGTSTRPALLQVGGQMVMAWKGAGNDSSIWMSTFIGDAKHPQGYPGLTVSPSMAGWSTRKQTSGPGGGRNGAPLTSDGPALVDTSSGVGMLWKGEGTDTTVWSGLLNLASGEIAQTRTNVVSAFTPAVCTFGTTLVMVWRGATDDDLYWATADGIGASWTHHGPITQAASSDRPALAVFNNGVYLAFKGPNNDGNIYVTQIDDPANLGTNNKAEWVYRCQVGGAGTSSGPGLCILNDRLFMAWKGFGSDTALWYSSSPDGHAWAPQTSLGSGGAGDLGAVQFGSAAGPVVATFMA